jgi:hypothetical protein
VGAPPRRGAGVNGRWPVGIGAAAVAAVTLTGCVSTQTTAARVRVNSARVRASQDATKVTHAGTAVRVTGVSVVDSANRARFVVTVRNPQATFVSDLPISIGYRTAAGKRVYLNAGTTATYFAAHLAAIGGHDTLSWVSDATRSLPRGAHPFALVGGHRSVRPAHSSGLPVITATTSSAGAASLKVSVHNTSGIPQYSLPVYAVMRRDGRPVAASQTSVTDLSGGATRTLHLRLLGTAAHARAVAQAPATILQ